MGFNRDHESDDNMYILKQDKISFEVKKKQFRFSPIKATLAKK